MSFEKIKLRWIMWVASKLPSCNSITEMVSESMERNLSLAERARMRLHFMICVWCTRYQRQLIALRESIRVRAQQAERDDSLPSLSPEARERIRKSLNRE
ncbi:MAG: hypothetical protein AB1631_20255 [Acidobacteriota bacterium]